MRKTNCREHVVAQVEQLVPVELEEFEPILLRARSGNVLADHGKKLVELPDLGRNDSRDRRTVPRGSDEPLNIGSTDRKAGNVPVEDDRCHLGNCVENSRQLCDQYLKSRRNLYPASGSHFSPAANLIGVYLVESADADRLHQLCCFSNDSRIPVTTALR